MFNLQIFYFIPHQTKIFETASNVHAFYKLGIWLLRLFINFEYEALNWPLFTFLSVTKKIILAFLQKKSILHVYQSCGFMSCQSCGYISYYWN